MQEPSPKSWCGRTESNRRHGDLQSPALPTELLPQINFHIVKDLYPGADEGSRTHTPSLIPGSEPSVATITPHPHFIGYYILFTPSMHCFNLIEPLSSPCLILQQESLSGSVSPYVKFWLDFPSTSLYWVTGSNRPQMLERHLA